MRRTLLVCLLLAPLAFGSDAPPRQLPEPDYLSPLARQVLRTKMRRHGDDMLKLVMAVTLLQHERARLFATEIAAEPRLTRPIAGGEDDLNAALPLQLFTLQDQLRLEAKAVAEAAAKADDRALAKALGRVTETCVACHSAFLKRDVEPEATKP